jgi:hypothetical protein
MGKSAPAPAKQEVVTSTSNLPEYARPYFEDVMGRAMRASRSEYVPYTYEDRIADFTPAEQQVRQNVLGLGSPNQFAVGSGLAASAAQGSMGAANYNPAQFSAQQVQAPQLERYGLRGPQMFGNEQAQQYMSPFIQQALEPQRRAAIANAKRGQLVQDLGSARQGAYGGSRQLLAGLERERSLGQQLGDVEARGMEAAFGQAQQQFERDRAAGMTTDQQNLEAALRQQQLGTQTGLQAALANQQTGLEAQRLGEQSRQFGASQKLAGYGQAGQLAQTLGNLGQYQQQADIQRLGAQGAAAGEVRSMDQQRRDQRYADFLRQRDFRMEQIGYLNNILRGLPVGLSTTNTTYATPPSMGSQVLGAGLGGLSMARLMGGG